MSTETIVRCWIKFLALAAGFNAENTALYGKVQKNNTLNLDEVVNIIHTMYLNVEKTDPFF